MGDGGDVWYAPDFLLMSKGITGESKMTIICSAADFEKIVTKQMNAQTAAIRTSNSWRVLEASTSIAASRPSSRRRTSSIAPSRRERRASATSRS